MGADMNAGQAQFTDYGEAGDRSGARRSRRAFRLCVISILMLTALLWIAERFLRYDHAESLYLSALTLPRESSRVMLLSAIRTAERRGEVPPAKYVQALAVRSEEEDSLPVFERAYELDEDDSLFALRFGARVFRDDPARAAEVFRRAASYPPPNALAAYLEASAIAASGQNETAIHDAMVVVARANNGGDPIIYPRPLWFATSALPQRGPRYAEQSREIPRELAVPLYAFGQQVVAAARNQMAEARMQHTRIWLEQLRTMGQRLARNCEPPGVGQIGVGIYLQQIAIDELRAIAAMEGAEPSEQLIESQVKLREASNMLAGFEESREPRIEADLREYTRPLRAFEWGAAVVIAAYLLVSILYRLTIRRKTLWALQHRPIAIAIWIVGGVLLLLLAHLYTILQSVQGNQNDIMDVLDVVWWVVLGAVLAFGVFYPVFTLKRVEDVSRAAGRPEEMAQLLPQARRAYWRAYASLVARYYGVWTGVFLCTACVWAISYRIFVGLYPWQIHVLATGLLEAERELAQQVIGLLS